MSDPTTFASKTRAAHHPTAELKACKLGRYAAIGERVILRDADSTLHAVASNRPDAVVVDIKMPPTHTDEGLIAAMTIHAEFPDIAVLVLSQYVEPGYALRLLEDHPARVGYAVRGSALTPTQASGRCVRSSVLTRP